VFNRPAATRRLLDALRVARPSQLYVAADGPRPGSAEDQERCRQVRDLVATVDWPCDVHRLYRPANIGLQASMVGAIDWFFAEGDAGVILEDDCIPAPDWFPFAGELRSCTSRR
jgi:hypothetical protein